MLCHSFLRRLRNACLHTTHLCCSQCYSCFTTALLLRLHGSRVLYLQVEGGSGTPSSLVALVFWRRWPPDVCEK